MVCEIKKDFSCSNEGVNAGTDGWLEMSIVAVREGEVRRERKLKK